MIISNLNHKGGVGKTTNTIHIASAMAEKGLKVLLIDCDNQCDLTFGVGVSEPPYTIVDFLSGSHKDAHKNFELMGISENLHILAGSPEFQAGEFKRMDLAKALQNPAYKLTERYDYIFIDVPPAGINPQVVTSAELALCCADYFIVPIEPEMLSIKNLNGFLAKAVGLKQYNPNLKFGGFYFCKVLSNMTFFKDYYTMMNEEYSNSLFQTFIRRDVEVINAIANQMTIFEYNDKCRAAEDYRDLTKEILEKLK